MTPTHTTQRIPRLLVLPTTLFGLALVALFGGSGSGLLGPSAAEAAQCKGASEGPNSLSAKRASRLVVCLVNKERRQRGQGALNRVDDLARAAKKHTAQMRRKGCFAHTCPGEPDLTGRLSRTSYLPCSCSWEAGENIAWGAGSEGSPRSVVKAWMNSSSHRARILDGSYQHVGVGFRHGSPFGGSKQHGTYTLDLGAKR